MPLRNSKPITYFLLFLTTAILNHTVRHTNYYADIKKAEIRNSGQEKRCSGWKKWTNVTFSEINKYLIDKYGFELEVPSLLKQ